MLRVRFPLRLPFTVIKCISDTQPTKRKKTHIRKRKLVSNINEPMKEGGTFPEVQIPTIRLSKSGNRFVMPIVRKTKWGRTVTREKRNKWRVV